MKPSLVAAAAALLLFAQNRLWAGNDAAEQLLTSAEQQGNLFRDNRSPILLEVSFVAQPRRTCPRSLKLAMGSEGSVVAQG